jgi:hypothetical protein
VITQLGEISLAAAVPLLVQFGNGLSAANGFAIPQLQVQLGGLSNVLGAISGGPPSLSATITAAQATVVSLQAAIGGPVVTLQIGAITAQIAALTALLNALLASAAALIIPSATISVYVFDGASGALGSELQSAVNGSLPGVGGHANALIFATTSPSVWTTLGGVFRTS